MKGLLLLLAFIPVSASAICAYGWYDKDGQTHLASCGSKRPETQCSGKNYWNGNMCVPVKIIEICESQGGTWKQARLRMPKTKIEIVSESIFDVCACPDQKVWDGKKCRSDIPLDQQCTNFFGNGTIRMTKEFFGSEDCPPIPK